MHSRKQSGKPDLARALVDGMRAAKHLRNVYESELDGSPNKGAKKKICKLATIFEECVLKGSRAANMGYAVDARYNEEFGHTSLEDLDKLASPSGGAASACATAEKQPRSRSLFRVEDTTESRPNLRVKLRKIGLVDVPLPKHGREYTPLEATEILLDLRKYCWICGNTVGSVGQGQQGPNRTPKVLSQMCSDRSQLSIVCTRADLSKI